MMVPDLKNLLKWLLSSYTHYHPSPDKRALCVRVCDSLMHVRYQQIILIYILVAVLIPLLVVILFDVGNLLDRPRFVQCDVSIISLYDVYD
jgi:hypothetical protein